MYIYIFWKHAGKHTEEEDESEQLLHFRVTTDNDLLDRGSITAWRRRVYLRRGESRLSTTLPNLLDLQQELAQNPSIRQCESASLGVTHELPSTASDISVDNGSSV
ncbi:hypothetical protein RB195_001257 [Necator americanus]|uniref:Uncharacterized protein n=1 Tax=Necator americanus TaxID=51031 RepID=A0ABR1DDL7_NECAM